jgi:TolB protein
VWVINADGSGQRALTSVGSWNDHPSWSPDGTRIVFSGKRVGNYDLYVIDVRTKHERRITSRPAADWAPTWSPDGTLIAFTAPEPTFVNDIWVVHPDGSGLRILTGSVANSLSPTWSPDGTKILFEREEFIGKDIDLYTVDLNGVQQKVVTLGWSELSPSWQPVR